MSAEAPTIESVRASVGVRQLAELLELEIEGDKILCPVHEENTPSCHLYDDHAWCFSCGWGGDVIDLWSVFTGRPFKRCLWDLHELTEVNDLPVVKREARPVELPDFTREVQLASTDPSDIHVAFLRSRWPGINPAIHLNKDWLVPVSRGFLVPHRHQNKVVGVKIRDFDGSKSAWPGSVFTTQLYVAHRADPFKVNPSNAMAVICEGESDAWAMASHTPEHISVYALPSGAACWKGEWLDQLTQYQTIYTAFDNDRAGNKATETVSKAIGFDRWKRIEIPGAYNDVNDCFGHSPGWEPFK